MDLHSVRRAAGLSQSALAAQTGISRPRLSAAECGYLELSEEEIAPAFSLRLLRSPNGGRRAFERFWLVTVLGKL